MRSRPLVAGWDWVKLWSPGVGQVYRWTGAARLAGPPATPLGGLLPGQPPREGSALRESSGRRAFRAAAQKFTGCVRVNFECAPVPLPLPRHPECPLRLGPASSGTVLGGRPGRGKFHCGLTVSGYGEAGRSGPEEGGPGVRGRPGS